MGRLIEEAVDSVLEAQLVKKSMRGSFPVPELISYHGESF